MSKFKYKLGNEGFMGLNISVMCAEIGKKTISPDLLVFKVSRF